MKSNRLYKFGIRSLSLVVFFRLVLLMYLYYKIGRMSGAYPLPVINIFTWREIAVLLLVITEALVYGWLQSRVQTKLWVRLHVYCLAAQLVLLPLLVMGLIFMISQHLSVEESTAMMKVVRSLRFYLMWILMVTGHSAFIVVLVKSSKKKIETTPDPEAGGILDEFTTE